MATGLRNHERYVRNALLRLKHLMYAPLRRKDALDWGHRLHSPDMVRKAAPGVLSAYLRDHHEGRGLWKWEHYPAIYERHLQQFDGRAPTLLEIGLYAGGGLDMWRCFLPDARIYGLDIDERCRSFTAPGTEILIGDQGDPAFWERTLPSLPPLDIVIDDGGHLSHQQITTAKAILPRMAPGGVYVVEDVHGERNPFLDWIDGLSRNLHSYQLAETFRPTGFQASIDSVHIYPYVIVIEMRCEALRTLRSLKHGSEWYPFEG